MVGRNTGSSKVEKPGSLSLVRSSSQGSLGEGSLWTRTCQDWKCGPLTELLTICWQGSWISQQGPTAKMNIWGKHVCFLQAVWDAPAVSNPLWLQKWSPQWGCLNAWAFIPGRNILAALVPHLLSLVVSEQNSSVRYDNAQNVEGIENIKKALQWAWDFFLFQTLVLMISQDIMTYKTMFGS